MLYALAHFLRDRCPFIWDLVDILNAFLFSLRYAGEMKQISSILKQSDSIYTIVPISDCKTDNLVEFFAIQPNEAFTHFHPHGFDAKSLKKLQGNKAFLAYIITKGNKIVGYFFLRSFFYGKTFIGRMVDADNRGKGIAKMMNHVTFDIASLLGIRVFQTISPENISSLKSAEAENELRILKTMPNGDLFVESLPKRR